MEPHRPPPSKRDSDRPRRSSRADALPLDAEWLDREALRYVARWEATRRGVTEILERKLSQRCARTGEDPESVREAIPRVVAGLVERGYVNDESFTEHFVERARRRGQSIAWIRARLEAKGIDSETLAGVLSKRAEEHAPSPGRGAEAFEVDEDLQAAWRIARKRRLGPFHPDPNKRIALRNRHLGVLARQGFSEEIAYHVIDSVLEGEPEDDAPGPGGGARR